MFGIGACAILYLNVQISQCFLPDSANHFDKQDSWIEPIDPVHLYYKNKKLVHETEDQ